MTQSRGLPVRCARLHDWGMTTSSTSEADAPGAAAPRPQLENKRVRPGAMRHMREYHADVVRAVAVSGAGLAGGWSRLFGRVQSPLASTVDSSPTAEIPQSPKHSLPPLDRSGAILPQSHGNFPSRYV